MCAEIPLKYSKLKHPQACIVQVDDQRIFGGFDGYLGGYHGRKNIRINPGEHDILVEFIFGNSLAYSLMSGNFQAGMNNKMDYELDDNWILPWFVSNDGIKIKGKRAEFKRTETIYMPIP
jgi:hypothetical protein